jgi:hypothetical protein
VDTQSWDDVVEVSMHTGSGRVRVARLMDWPPDLPPLTLAGPGDYRVRLHARGRDTSPDLVAFDAREEYLITAWPAAPAPDMVFRYTDNYGARLRRSAQSAPPPAEPKLTEDEQRFAAQREQSSS